MADVDKLRRKLAKLRKNPHRFFLDSPNAALRALGVFWKAPPEPAKREKRPRKDERLVALHRDVIESSGLFDASFYFEKYPDVRKRRDQLDHYVRSGMREGRWPNAYFDPVFYARQVGLDAREDAILHYIQHGEAEGIAPSSRFDPRFYLSKYPDVAERGESPLRHFLQFGRDQGRSSREGLVSGRANGVSFETDLRDVPVTILIPVFNGHEHVRRCVEAVLARTRMSCAEILIIDDASTDGATRALLEAYADVPRVTLLRNEQNRGFTRTVNRGIQHARGRDIVLLNSDTIVGPRWLEALALAAYGTRRTATATALSDNAGAFSTPDSGSNATHERWAVHHAARMSQRSAVRTVHHVPTGNGFCMYMRRDAIDATGLLDPEHFPRGYGEENDWCMRAGELGWQHVIALGAYVHHVNAVSFGADAKARLRDEARVVLEGLHPDYRVQVARAFSTPGTALEQQRQELKRTISATKQRRRPPRPRVMYVISTRTGGTPQTNEDLMRGVADWYDPLLLVCDTTEMQLFDCSVSPPRELAYHSLSQAIALAPHRSAEYDAVIAAWMASHSVELVHIRHIAWHSLGLVDAARRQGIPVVCSFHDFYAMCPSVNLTDGTERWSAVGVTRPHVLAPLWSQRDPHGVAAVQRLDPHAFLALWQRRMNAMLSRCDAFVTTSPSVKSILSENLPVLRERESDFHVIPHGRDFDRFLPPPDPPRPDEPLRVLLAGNINEAKGLDTVLELLRLDEAGLIELHMVGNVRKPLEPAHRVHVHGPYRREELARIVESIAPHVGLIPTICPETFCHTLTECWAAGLPVVGSDLGAVGERIASSGAGWTVDPHDARGILSLLQRIRDGREQWADRVGAVVRWQETIGSESTVETMADQYIDVYQDVMTRHRPFLPSEGRRSLGLPKKIAVVVASGHYPHVMATAHVRMATPISRAAGEPMYDWIDAEELIATGVADYDGVLVCRNASHPRGLRQIVRQCERAGVPLVSDLDDDLLNVPPEKDPDGRYAAIAPALRDVMRASALVMVSTEPLRAVCAPIASQVLVVPNRLDPAIWIDAPPDTVVPPSELARGGALRVVFMGSLTHGEDLEMLLPAIERLRREQHVVLHTIGVSRDLPSHVVALHPPDERYDRFCRWFRGVSAHFDIAVAPLVDTPFNRSKSALKFMEYAACGLPVVASRVAPYAAVVRHGVDGLLADNDVEAWHAALAALATGPDLRAALGGAARRRAEHEFACRSCVFDELPWREWSARRAHPRARVESISISVAESAETSAE